MYTIPLVTKFMLTITGLKCIICCSNLIQEQFLENPMTDLDIGIVVTVHMYTLH